MIDTDVVVVGAGPAGATFALNLAPMWRVVLLDRSEPPTMRIGESLAPAARRLLDDMGLWSAFIRQEHAPCHGAISVWGSATQAETTDLRDLDGSGWHLDRARFDGWLREVAVQRGAAMLAPARLLDIKRQDAAWSCMLDIHGRRLAARCRLIVDAGGRGSSVGRRFGTCRIVDDRLICGWIHGHDLKRQQSGLRHIEAEPEGWWYTASLPSDRRVVAFHTDADLPAAAVAAEGGQALLRRASRLGMLGEMLAAAGFAIDGNGGFCAAYSARLDPPTGDGWLAVGDAALSFDPLSSQGLLNSLYTGLAAAEAAHRMLSGDTSAFNDYAARILRVQAAYNAHLADWYGRERRWMEQPFWKRRQQGCRATPDQPAQNLQGM